MSFNPKKIKNLKTTYINKQKNKTGKMSGSISNLLNLKSKFGSCLGLKCESKCSSRSKSETNGKIKFSKRNLILHVFIH